MSVYVFLFVIGLTCGKGTALRSKRFIIDSLTGWSSWEQYAACSVHCMSWYEGETKHCCETGNNRVCYNLPWEKIKPYVGACATSTTMSSTSRTRTTGPTDTTSLKTDTTSPKTSLFTMPPSTTQITSNTRLPTTTRLERTSPPITTWPPTTTWQTSAPPTIPRTKVMTTTPYRLTLPPVPTICKVCAGPEFLCEKLYMNEYCEYPNNYCINHLTNHLDGSRSVIRSCGNFDTCYRDWYLGSADVDKCRRFDENNIITIDFSCTFCCVKDNCNLPIRPNMDTLYIERK